MRGERTRDVSYCTESTDARLGDEHVVSSEQCGVKRVIGRGREAVGRRVMCGHVDDRIAVCLRELK